MKPITLILSLLVAVLPATVLLAHEQQDTEGTSGTEVSGDSGGAKTEGKSKAGRKEEGKDEKKGKEKEKEGEEEAGKRPADSEQAAGVPLRAPSEKVVVADSRDLPPSVQEESRVMRGPEVRQVIEISRHRGSPMQLFLYAPPWGGPPLFSPGIAIPLETGAQRARREAAQKGLKPAEEEEPAPAKKAAPSAP